MVTFCDMLDSAARDAEPAATSAPSYEGNRATWRFVKRLGTNRGPSCRAGAHG
jgi:hypothetical protein